MPDYNALARERILALLEEEHAAVWPEIEAKIAEPRSNVQRVEPHHLLNARWQLRRAGVIQEQADYSYGGHLVAVLTFVDQRRRVTAVSRTAATKRRLQARYLSWAGQSASGRPAAGSNYIGRGGETVLRASLKSAAEAGTGLSIAPGGAAGVSVLFGGNTPVPIGPLDGAAYLTAFDQETGVPVGVTVLIEAKNIRHWIYPRNPEPYQLLAKAAALQEAYPGQLFVPVLIARRVQYLTHSMAKDLGFLAFYTGVQPIQPHHDTPENEVEEINDRLGYSLVRTEDAHKGIVHTLTQVLPAQAVRIARRFQETASVIGPHAALLRDPGLADIARAQAMREFRETVVEEIEGAKGKWLARELEAAGGEEGWEPDLEELFRDYDR